MQLVAGARATKRTRSAASSSKRQSIAQPSSSSSSSKKAKSTPSTSINSSSANGSGGNKSDNTRSGGKSSTSSSSSNNLRSLTQGVKKSAQSGVRNTGGIVISKSVSRSQSSSSRAKKDGSSVDDSLRADDHSRSAASTVTVPSERARRFRVAIQKNKEAQIALEKKTRGSNSSGR